MLSIGDYEYSNSGNTKVKNKKQIGGQTLQEAVT